ncbi:MAG: tetratricopeptide repeat protein [Alphaproteobacteria bacterium]|nr:tetratricopeptide repeat protein [Alphaproteobacteria bacterium]
MQNIFDGNNKSSVIVIQGLTFSPRELDVMACIMNGRTSKKAIAATLQINPGTASTHTRNIMQKLNCSSWEHIRDFIERSGQEDFIQKHLKRVLGRKPFDLLLHQLAEQLIGIDLPLCQIVYEPSESEGLLPIVHKIEDAFKNVGIVVQQTVAQNIFSIPSTATVRILRLSQKHIGADIINIADYPNSEALIIKGLEIVVGEGALKELKASFKGSVTSLSSEVCPTRASQSFFRSLSGKLVWLRARVKHYNNFTVSAAVLSFLGVAGVVIWFTVSLASPKTLRSDLALPPTQVCLQRSDLVETIQRQLKVQQTNTIPMVTLVGLGGVGKTMVARIVGKQHSGSVVWELNAGSLSTLKTSFKELADVLARTAEQQTEWRHLQSMPQGEAKDRKILAFVKSALQKEPNWLLIYDNVETLSDMKAYLPLEPETWGRGHVLITTCNANLQHAYFLMPENMIHMDELTDVEALNLFTRTLYGTRNLSSEEHLKAAEFLRHIPHFPLDISVTAQYIRHNQISYQEYLERMQQQAFHETQEAMLRETHQYRHSRHHLMMVSLQQVLDSNPEFADLLLMMCCLEANHIPRAFLDAYKSQLVVDTFMLQMKKYSLIHQESSFGTYPTVSIPKMMQTIGLDYLNTRLGAQQLPHRQIAMLQAIERVIQKTMDEENSDLMKVCEPHLKKLLTSDFQTTQHAILEGLIGCVSYYLGEDDQTLTHLSQSINTLKENPSLNEGRIALALSYLGDTYKNKGDYSNAIRCLEEASKLYSQHDGLSLRHARTLTYLGNTYRLKGVYGKARAVLEHSLSIYKKHPERAHESAQPLGVLSTVYRDMGEYTEAIQLMEDSLKRYKDHQTYPMWRIGIRLCLGSTYTAAGDYKKGRDILLDCEASLKKLYSDHHALYPWIQLYLGDAYRHLGDIDKAKLHLEDSVTHFKQLFSEHHAGYAIALSRLGALYVALHQLELATSTLQKSLALMEQLFGKGHVQTGYPHYQLGRVYLADKDYDRAGKALHQSLDRYQQMNHTDMYRPLEALGELYHAQAQQAKENRNTVLALQEIQRAKEYSIRALDIVRTRCSSSSEHLKRLTSKLNSIEEVN